MELVTSDTQPDNDEPYGKVFPLPYKLDLVLSPEIVYTGIRPQTALYHTAEVPGSGDDVPVRITFENLDSLSMSRGEYERYPLDASDMDDGIVFTIENSPWLGERYNYESQWYRDAYEWGGDVDEMLHEYRHFYFAFHDEFVEVIARGLWCELMDLTSREWPHPDLHPLSGLTIGSPVLDSRAFDGALRTMRGSSRTTEELERDSTYCSQPLYAIGVAEDVGYQVVLRQHRGGMKTCFLDTWGTVRVEHDGVASIEDAWSMYSAFLERHG